MAGLLVAGPPEHLASDQGSKALTTRPPQERPGFTEGF